MAQVITNSGHDDMITDTMPGDLLEYRELIKEFVQHDAVLDYYGRRLATCSSDKTIKIFDIDGENHKLTETLRGHEGAVWCVAWAHPKFGTILASSSYDGRVLIWRSTPSPSNPQVSSFQKVFESTLHSASVNLLSWAPHECGCLLACASSDGSISVLEFDNNAWEHVILNGAHGLGVNSVSWAPATRPGSLVGMSGGTDKGSVRRFVSGGSDCLIKIWEWSQELRTYTNTRTLEGHSDWVRDVAWSPSVLLKSYIASASQDKTVRIWTTDADGSGEWRHTQLDFDAVLWRVSWSLSGNVLAVSQGDNKVSLWKEDLAGHWECIRTIEE